MSLAWWMGLGVVAAVGAVLSGLHWTVVDFLLDRG
jgi:hypothetical protein